MDRTSPDRRELMYNTVIAVIQAFPAVSKIRAANSAYSGERDRSFRVSVTAAQCVVLRA